MASARMLPAPAMTRFRRVKTGKTPQRDRVRLDSARRAG
jgi:hypothetical protein